MNEAGLVKVHIDLPNHWAVGGESLWATPLGEELYRIENVPFYAYGLNFLDVVRATTDEEELKPEIRKVVQASGRRTIRISFFNETTQEEQDQILNALTSMGVSYERAFKRMIALDIKPELDYNALFSLLEEYAAQEKLDFETCEARLEGSFDDIADESEHP